MKENFICVNICNGQSFYIKPMDFRLFGGFYSLHSVLFNHVKQLHTLILETKDTTIHEMAFNLFFSHNVSYQMPRLTLISDDY